MPIPEPVLDNRDFDQLVAEGVARIPRLAPSWTDYNASDPGITFLELFAWLSEQNQFRMDRETSAALRGFLRLVGIELAPPTVATTVIEIGNNSGATMSLPARMQMHGDPDLKTSKIPGFETQNIINVSPAKLTNVLTWSKHFTDVTQTNTTQHDESFPDEGSFNPFGNFSYPGASLYLGFDRELGDIGSRISLYFATTTLEDDKNTRTNLTAEWEAEKARVSRDCPNGNSSISLVEPPHWQQHYSVKTMWEYWTASGTWAELPSVEDQTRALSLSGFVQFDVPPNHASRGAGSASAFFIRCRIVAGEFECPPRLERILFNAVGVEHATSHFGEPIGNTHGYANAEFSLTHGPIIAGSTRLTLGQGPNQQNDWFEVLHWDQVGAHQRAYQLQPEKSLIRFGNGRQGEVPATALAIEADYQSGGGIDGNFAANKLTHWNLGQQNQGLVPNWLVQAHQLSIAQPLPSTGGRASQTLASGQADAIDKLAKPTKAVTLADYEALAKDTPGVPVGRAWAISAHHPATPCWKAYGAISLIIVPDCAGPAPMPSAELLKAVSRWLNPRRLITSELHVLAPHYVSVEIHAVLHTTRESDAESIRTLAEQRIAEFFHPLHGGPNNVGWPAGRSVYRSEIFSLLAKLSGVTQVSKLKIGRSEKDDQSCDNLTICARDLIRAGNHQFQIRPEGGATKLQRSQEHEC